MTVYLDNAATTKTRPEVAEVVAKAMTENYGNPSSLHFLGRQAKEALEMSRKTVAKALGAEADTIFFTSGGSEADNWAISAAAKHMRGRGKHILTTAVEHDAVLKSMAALSDAGFEVEYLKPDKNGSISLEILEKAIRSDTILVSMMLVNNETGVVMPVEATSKIIKAKRSPALLHTDAVQAFMKLPFSARSTGADLISLSAHKIHGPKGVGALYIRKGLRLSPLIVGGGQEKGARSGTEPLPLIMGFAEAVTMALREGFLEERYKEFKKSIAESAVEKYPKTQIIGEGCANILCLSLPGYRSEVLLNYLDAAGICVSRGSACTKGGRSHVLEAMGLPPAVIDGSIRISFSHETTSEEISYFNEVLAKAVKTIATAR